MDHLLPRLGLSACKSGGVGGSITWIAVRETPAAFGDQTAERELVLFCASQLFCLPPVGSLRDTQDASGVATSHKRRQFSEVNSIITCVLSL